MNELWKKLLEFFSDEERPEEAVYDPFHFAAMIVLVIFALGLLFWLLWTLLIFGGGLFRKIGPAFKVLFTDKTLQDYGWVGYPYEMGIFEGFIANSIALVLTIALVWGIWWLFERTERKSDKPES